MDNHYKEIIKEYKDSTGENVEFIGLGDMFDFECQQCGCCCKGRNDIVLSPIDVFHIAQATGKTTMEVCDIYCTMHIGPNSGMPVVCLGQDNAGKCHFLKLDISDGFKYKCSIDRYKPGACRNHPIGIVTGFKKDKEEIDINDEYSENYIIVEQCVNSMNHNCMHKVEDWVKNTLTTPDERKVSHMLQIQPLNMLNIPEFYTMIINVFVFLTHLINPEEHMKPVNLPDKTIGEIFRSFVYVCGSPGATVSSIFTDYMEECKTIVQVIKDALYYNYDNNNDFFQQAAKNLETMKNEFRKAKEMHDALYDFAYHYLHLSDKNIFYKAADIDANGEYRIIESFDKLVIDKNKEVLNNACSRR